MSKLIETDTKTFVKFWTIPVIIILVLFILEKATTKEKTGAEDECCIVGCGKRNG